MRRQVTLSDELWRETKIFAVAAGISTSTLVEKAIRAWIADNFVETPLELPTIPLAASEVERRTDPGFGYARPAPKPLKRK